MFRQVLAGGKNLLLRSPWKSPRVQHSMRGLSLVCDACSESSWKNPDGSSRVRLYHSSALREFPIRRRKRPTARKEDTSEEEKSSEDAASNNALKHVAVEDDVQFVQAANALFDKLEKALEPMKKSNDPFIVERSFGDFGEVLTIDLGPKEGKYRVEMSLEDHVFEYTSPISGKLLYVLSSSSGEWVGIEDGHLFEGLLVRDLIRQCQGLPNL